MYEIVCLKEHHVITIGGESYCFCGYSQRGFILRDHSNNYEMAPIFDAYETALEIRDKANSNTRFFNRIPVVPIGSPIPRPDDIKVQVPKHD